MVEKQTITTGKTSTVYSMTVMALMTGSHMYYSSHVNSNWSGSDFSYQFGIMF